VHHTFYAVAVVILQPLEQQYVGTKFTPQ